MERHRVYDLLDQLWVRDASDQQLADFRESSDFILAGMADAGHATEPPPRYWCVLREIEPPPRYWCVLREIERRQLAQVCGDGGSLNHREVRRV